MSATAPAKSASPVVHTVSVTGLVAGLFALFDGLAQTHGIPAAATVAKVLAGSGLSLGSVWAVVAHHNKTLDHDAKLAVSKVPDLEQLRADVDKGAETTMKLVEEDNPALASKIEAGDRELRNELMAAKADLEAKITAATGLTATQQEQDATAALKKLRELLDQADTPADTAQPGGAPFGFPAARTDEHPPAPPAV